MTRRNRWRIARCAVDDALGRALERPTHLGQREIANTLLDARALTISLVEVGLATMPPSWHIDGLLDVAEDAAYGLLADVIDEREQAHAFGGLAVEGSLIR